MEFKPYSHPTKPNVPPGENRTIPVYLERDRLPQPVPSTVKLLVFVEKRAPAEVVAKPSVAVKHDISQQPISMVDLRALNEREYMEEGIGVELFPLDKWTVFRGQGSAVGLDPVSANAEINGYSSMPTIPKSLAAGKTTVLDLYLNPKRPNIDLFVKRSDSGQPVSGVSVRIWDPKRGESFSTADPLSTNADGRINGIQLPALGDYSISVLGDSDKFKTYTSNSFAVTGHESLIPILIDPISKSPQSQPPVASNKLDPAFADALCKLLHEGWENPSTAQQYLSRLRQAGAGNPVMPFAISLITAKQENYGGVNALLKRMDEVDSFVWDRAAEARIRVGMLLHDYPLVKEELGTLASIYADRAETEASLETTRVMGLALGALKSLKDMEGNVTATEYTLQQRRLVPTEKQIPIADVVRDLDQLQRSITGLLRAGHKTAFNRGMAEAPTTFDPIGNQALAGGTQISSGDNISATTNPNQKTIDNLMASRAEKTARRKGLASNSPEYGKISGEIVQLSQEITRLGKSSATTTTTTATETRPGQVAQPSFEIFSVLPLETWRNELLDKLSPCSSKSSSIPRGEPIPGATGRTGGERDPVIAPKPSSGVARGPTPLTFTAALQNAANQRPLRRVAVELKPPGSRDFSYKATTDLDGKTVFKLTHGEGLYDVRFSGGELPTTQQEAVFIRSNDSKTFSLDCQIPTPNASLETTLHATVKDQAGNLVPGVLVELQPPGFLKPADRQTKDQNGVVQLTLTNGIGMYHIYFSGTMLEPEQKTFCPIEVGENKKNWAVNVRSSGRAPTAPSPTSPTRTPNNSHTIFGTVSIMENVEQSYQVNVPYTEQVNGKSIAGYRQETKTRRVPVSKQVPGSTVSIEPLRGLVLPRSVVTTTRSDAMGRFEFGGLPAGWYRLTASYQGWKNATQEEKVVAGGSNRFGPVELQLEKIPSATLPATAPPEKPPTASLVDYLRYKVFDIRQLSNNGFPPIPADLFRGVKLSDLEGTYLRLPVEGGYHRGKLVLLEPGERAVFEWRNVAPISWRLFPRLSQGLLETEPSAPYHEDGHTAFYLIPTQDEKGVYQPEVAGFSFQNELYERAKNPNLQIRSPRSEVLK